MKQIRSIFFLTYHFPSKVGRIQTRIAHYLQELRKRGIWETVLVVSERILVPESDTRRLAEALISILLDMELADRMGRSAVRITQSRFAWSAVISRLLQTYGN